MEITGKIKIDHKKFSRLNSSTKGKMEIVRKIELIIKTSFY